MVGVPSWSSWDSWYRQGRHGAQLGIFYPLCDPDDKEAQEAWRAGVADYIIRTANGKPVDQPNSDVPGQVEKDPNAGTYADSASGVERRDDGVGDVNSTARGTGARKNAGKAKLEYVPFGALSRLLRCRDDYQHAAAHGLLAVALAGFEDRSCESGLGIAFQHIPAEFRLKSTCAVFDFGAKKYATFNWAKGMAWSIPLACIKRHWEALARGEEVDAESGESHWGHIGCNIVMLAHYVQYYREGDDRPPAWAFGGQQ